jgi:predicted alpha/beta-hydrolase family hydrolase
MDKKVFIEVYKNRRISAVIKSPRKIGSLSGCIFIIAHGSSNDLNHDLIKGVSDIYCANGATTVRFNFLFKEEKKVSDDIKKDNFVSYIKIFEYVKKNLASKNDYIFACGKSLGAKVGAELISSNKIMPNGFLSFGYPLHSKHYFGRLKFFPLRNISVPSFFFTGEYDPLCRKELFFEGLTKLDIDCRHFIVKNGDHGLRVGSQYSDKLFKNIFKETEQWIQNYF